MFSSLPVWGIPGDNWEARVTSTLQIVLFMSLHRSVTKYGNTCLNATLVRLSFTDVKEYSPSEDHKTLQSNNMAHGVTYKQAIEPAIK